MLRIVLILLLCFIVINLFFGLYTILRDRSAGTRAVRTLTVRVVLSVLLFFLIMIAATNGWLDT